MKSLINTVINSLKIRSEELATVGLGGGLPLRQPDLNEGCTNVPYVNRELEIKTKNLTTSSQLCKKLWDFRDGTPIPCGSCALPPDFKYCAYHAMTSKPEERMKDEKKSGEEKRKEFKETPWICYCGEGNTWGGRLALELHMMKHGGDESKLEQANEMHKSPTGALRDNKGKAPLSWVPFCVIEAIATVLFKNSVSGGGKYPEHNWKKGAQYSVPLDSLLRHAFKCGSGEEVDPDDGLNHSWKILTNAAFLVFYEKFYPELNDLYNKDSK
jgi:hypothetical protein